MVNPESEYTKEEIKNWYEGSTCVGCGKENCDGSCPEYTKWESDHIGVEDPELMNVPVVPCKPTTNPYPEEYLKKEVKDWEELVIPSVLENEKHLTILGIKLTSFLRIGWGFWPVEGNPGFVDASCNMLKIIKHRKWLIAQYHTHPSFPNQFSSQDDATFKAFVETFCYDLLFPIESKVDGTATWCVRKVNKHSHTFLSHFRTWRLGRLFIFIGY